MSTDDGRPSAAEFENIGQDHTRNRAAAGWLNEAFGLCLVSFGVSTFDVVRAVIRQGRPLLTSILAMVLFGISTAAFFAAFRTTGPESTLAEPKRRRWRVKLIAALALASVPVVIGGAGTVQQLATLWLGN